MKFKKEIKILIIVIIFVVLVFVGLCCNQKNNFFNYNLMELLTLSIASVLIYYLSKKDDKEKRKNDKIENLINRINLELSDISLEIPTLEEKNKYLYIFKYISNKFIMIEKLVESEDTKNLENAKQEFDKLRDFINDNINQPPEYFKGLKHKIPNYISNIESYLDNIIVNIYAKK